MMTARTKVLLFVLICVMILGALYLRGLAQERTIVETAKKETIHFQKSFGNVSLGAKAAYVYDIRNHAALFSRNADAPLPLASLTKVMTALVALNTLPQNAVITIGGEALMEEGDSGLFAGERWVLSDLVRLMLVESSNDAAKAISIGTAHVVAPDSRDDSAFIDLMNKQALSLNLPTMHFRNANGLDATDLSWTGGTGSAHDMTMVAIELLQKFPAVFNATAASSLSVRSIDGFVHKVKNTNTTSEETQLLFSSKTGFTDLAGGNLSIIFDAGPGRPVAVTVLGSTEEGRFADVSALVRATMRYITAQ
jgi:D-alanyl-D-alanine carboxypeptidase